jgi:hypothetical protein
MLTITMQFNFILYFFIFYIHIFQFALLLQKVDKLKPYTLTIPHNAKIK